MIRIIGLDPSYTGFGVSIKDHEETMIRTFRGSFPLKKFPDEFIRLLEIYHWLNTSVWEARVDIPKVFIEGYAPGSKYGREMAGELGGIVKLSFLLWSGVGSSENIHVVAPTTLKKFVTGKGTGPKNIMLQQVYKRWGKEFHDDNEADAYSLTRFGLAYLDLDTDLTKVQQEVISKYKKEHPLT